MSTTYVIISDLAISNFRLKNTNNHFLYLSKRNPGTRSYHALCARAAQDLLLGVKYWDWSGRVMHICLLTGFRQHQCFLPQFDYDRQMVLPLALNLGYIIIYHEVSLLLIVCQFEEKEILSTTTLALREIILKKIQYVSAFLKPYPQWLRSSSASIHSSTNVRPWCG